VLPTGGHYVSGTGSIAKKGAKGLSIDQASTTGIIDWSSFSIGKGNKVQFNNGAGATLNRVTGGNLSTIDGSLQATGSLYLINPQGVIVSRSGRVVTGGGFLASTREESNADFLGRRRKFVGRSNGTVSNDGTIRSANGDVTLIGSEVSNTGNLAAKNGTASLNAGNRVLLVPAGGRILVSGGSGSASNSGTLQSAQAQINAAGGNVYALAGNNGGIVRASGTSTVDGHVWLTSKAGNVTISGKVAATNIDGSGGAITARGNTILISGKIDASATKATKIGGDVSFVAHGTTKLSGTVIAKGGKHGAGGLVETSGKHLRVADGARVDTRSKNGISGEWLIDPNDFTIAASGGDITGADLSSNLGTTDVAIKSSDGATTGSGDVIVNDTVSWTSSHTLSLDAYRNIDVNAPIAVGGNGDVSLIYGDESQNGTGDPLTGDLMFGAAGHITFSDVVAGDVQGTLSINGLNFSLVSSVSDLADAVAASSSGNYALANDYDAALDGTYTSSPVGGAFIGTLEGLGNTVRDISIEEAGTDTNVGLFEQIGVGGEVRNLRLVDASIFVESGDSEHIGGVAGISLGTVRGVSVSGSFHVDLGLAEVGGILGRNEGVVTGSSSSADVSVSGSNNKIGGLVGMNTANGTISQSAATGMVATVYENAYERTPGSNNSVGGLVGANGGSIASSDATGEVNAAGFDWAGGLAGRNTGHIVTSYATGAVNSQNDPHSLGGLVGINQEGTISDSHATGNVSGGSGYFGGFVGYGVGGSISNAYSTGYVHGYAGDIGGFAGLLLEGASISSSYATGNVSADVGVDGEPATTVGGFVGWIEDLATIDQSYALGTASAVYLPNTVVGGFAGRNDSSIGSITSVYFNADSNDIGVGVGTDMAHGGGLSRSQMGDYRNFQGWTFGTTPGGAGWVTVGSNGALNDGSTSGAGTAPILLTEYSTDIASAHQLQLMALAPSADYFLTNDVNAIGSESYKDVWGSGGFRPIGGTTIPSRFSGTFNGNGHSISNLSITQSNDPAGLFGSVDGGVIENVGLINANVAGNSYVGGLVGRADDATIERVFVSGALQGGSTANLGGLVGIVGGTTSIANSWTDVAITGEAALNGGIAGWLQYGTTITQSHADGYISVSSGSAGGLVGYNSAGTISFSYAAGGGVATGGTYAGGIAGMNIGTITDVYASETVIGSSAGALVGHDLGGDVENTFWNTDAVGSMSAIAVASSGTTTSNLSGLSRADMQKTSSFSGWSFGGLGSGANWVLIGADGSVNNPADTEGGTLPMLLSEYSESIANAHQLQLMTLDLSQNYALSNNVDGTATSSGGVWGSDGFIAVGGNNFLDTGFSGTFDGQGHTISNLWIADDANTNVGLFGTTTAGASISQLVVDNLSIYHTAPADSLPNNVGGLVGSNGGAISHVSMTGEGDTIFVDGVASVGGIAGDNGGSIRDSNSSLAVVASNDTDQGQGVGGLVGFNSGDISNTWTTQSVSADGGAAAGGLVGFNSAGISGTAHISSSYATGSVSSGSGSADAGGLVGTNWIGLVESSYATGTVIGFAMDAGGLVGYVGPNATITTSYASGYVLSSADDAAVGGFVGTNDGTITKSFTTGNAQSASNGIAGGFVGINTGGIANSYAMGNVTADLAGGFVGQNTGAIATSYSLGIASGANAGGFAGVDNGTTTNSFWDTDTSGLLIDSPAGGVSQAEGKTTADAQQGFTDTYDGSIWGLNRGGSFAYLRWQFGTGADPTAVSGKVYADSNNASAGAGISVSLTDKTGNLGTVFTYADGSFYELLANSPTSGVLASAGLGTSFSNVTDNYLDYTGISIYASGQLSLQTVNGSLSSLADSINALTGFGHDFPQIVYDFGAEDVSLETFASSFQIDQEIDVGPGALTLNAHGALNETGGGYISAGTLNGTAASSVSLTNSNRIDTLGLFSTSANSGFALTDEQTLTLSGALRTGTGAISIRTTGAGHGFNADGIIAGGTVSLNSAGTIKQNAASGKITATTLQGSSVGAAVFGGSNRIAALGTFSTGGTGAFVLTDARDLTVKGAVRTGTGTVSIKTTGGTGHYIAVNNVIAGGIVSLISAGAIKEDTSAGKIVATTFKGSAGAAAALGGANRIASLGSYSTGGNGAFILTNEVDLALDGVLRTGTGTVALKTTGAGHDIAINGTIAGGTVSLISAGTLIENASTGKISASTLKGSSVGTAAMGGANSVVTLAGFANSGTGNLAFVDMRALTVTGTVSAAASNAVLTLVTRAGNLNLNGVVKSNTVTLSTAGEAIQTTKSAITTKKLNVTAKTGIDLIGANHIAAVGTRKTTSGPNIIKGVGL